MMKQILNSTDCRGALSFIFAVPTTSLVKLTLNSSGIYVPEFRNLDQVINIPVLPGHKYQFKEDNSVSNGGNLFSLSISGVIRPLTAKDRQIIDDLVSGEWLVLTVDTVGLCRLSGTVDVPLRFAMSDDSGADFSDKKIISFSFSAKEKSPSVICNVEDIPFPMTFLSL